MKFLSDFFPVLLFFVAYKIWGIYTATAVAIVASFAQVGWNYWRHGRVETMHWITLGLIVVFGGLTLVLHDPLFIKWKPTVINGLFAVAFLASGLFMERSFLQRMMDHAISLPREVWFRLNMAWVAFFAFSGIANIYVALNYSEDTWVNFKMFGLLGLTIAFVIGQGFYLMRYVQPLEED